MWKVIPGTDGGYSANDETGEIRSNDRIGPDGRRLKGTVLRPWLQNNGYAVISMHINKEDRRELVHRVIARTFLSNPDNLPAVNHKDGNRLNNKLENLEYVTFSENIRHGVKNGTVGKKISRYHSIHMLTLDGTYLESFDSIKEAADYVGISAQCIQHVLQDKSSTAGGFKWVDDRMFGM